MTLSIEQLQHAFKSNNNSGNQRDSNYYPIWKLPDGESCEIRFLPDKNSDNPMGFLLEKRSHRLIINGETRNVPCLTMYGDECPICTVSSAFYKKEDKQNGKKFWRKRNHIAQALIIHDPLPADSETGENFEGQVKLVSISYQIYTVIKDAFESGDLDAIPYDYAEGTNFVIKRTLKRTPEGDFGDYTVGTKFARKSSSLDKEIISYVEDRMIDLETALPPKPDIDGIEQTLQAALTGNPMESQERTHNSTSGTHNSTSEPENSNTGSNVDADEKTQQLLDKIKSRRQG